jgi:hypothetical protein
MSDYGPQVKLVRLYEKTQPKNSDELNAKWETISAGRFQTQRLAANAEKSHSVPRLSDCAL